METKIKDTKAQIAPRKQQGLFLRFKKDTRGVAAIEFAMLALPFFLLVFAILESCLSFTGQQMMANVVDDVARSVRVGTLRTADATPTYVRGLICTRMEALVKAGCPDLLVDLKQYATVSAIPTTIKIKADGDIDTAGFTVSVGGQGIIHSLRVFYRWPFYTDFIASRLSNLPGNKTLIFTTATWRNEPFIE
jgi:Flp pilus assembly protein TadG